MQSVLELRRDARMIFTAGLEAVEAGDALGKLVRRDGQSLDVAGQLYDLSDIHRIVVVGAGKASARMAQALEDRLVDRIDCGIVVVKDGYTLPTRKIRILEAGHPIPDNRSLTAATEITHLVETCARDDLVVCLLSGGASALLSAPLAPLSLEDERIAAMQLLNCGATIQEINAIRKHTSRLKGGRLASLSSPAQLTTLILSDVIGDPIDSIGSGPTAPDPTTFADCLEIVDRYDLRERLPARIIEILQAGATGAIEETPKPGNPLFANVQNTIIGNNRLALTGAKEKAEALGYHTLVLSSSVEGESSQAARFHTAIAREIIASGLPVQPPACLLSSGETTVTVRRNGLGGRAQEFSLAAALNIAGSENVVVLAAGTDGTDGLTGAAGAIVDNTTVDRAKSLGLHAPEFLRRNDSYPLLEAVNDLLFTGPTFTNVMDLHVILVG